VPAVLDDPRTPLRPQPLPSHALLLLAALAAAAVAQGAYHAPGQVLVAAGMTSAVVVALRRSPVSVDDLRTGPLPALAALAAWALARAALAGDPRSGLGPAALAAGVAAVVLVCRRIGPAQRPALAGAAVSIGVLVALTAWVGVAWHLSPWASPGQGLWRAAATLTYANATAGLLVPLALVALARCADHPRTPPAQAAAALLLTGLGATLSRGGALALAVGLAVLAWRLGPGRLARAAATPALGAAVALAGLLPGLLEHAPARPLPAVAALLGGLFVAVTPAVVPALAPRAAMAASAVALACLLGGAGLAVAAGVLPGTATALPGTPTALPGAPTTLPGSAGVLASTRLTAASDDRAAGTRAALRLVAREPLIGMGPGRAPLFFQDRDGRLLMLRYAHNEYLQVLAELGAVGLGLLLAALAGVAVMVARGRDLTGSTALGAAVPAALAALAVHSALDFLWHLPVLPLTGALLAGLTSPPATREDEGGAATGSAELDHQ
jgi:O-Antigen ligase